MNAEELETIIEEALAGWSWRLSDRGLAGHVAAAVLDVPEVAEMLALRERVEKLAAKWEAGVALAEADDHAIQLRGWAIRDRRHAEDLRRALTGRES